MSPNPVHPKPMCKLTLNKAAPATCHRNCRKVIFSVMYVCPQESPLPVIPIVSHRSHGTLPPICSNFFILGTPWTKLAPLHMWTRKSKCGQAGGWHSTEITGRIQCEVLTTLPFCFSWIKKFLGQQLKI